MARKRGMGRQAVDTLKQAYRDGTAFADIYAVRDFLITSLRVKPAYVTWADAGNWDRTARLENADDEYATTYPSRAIGFQRDPNADADTRSDSHRTDLKYLATRGRNALRSAHANAVQSDATKAEIRREARLEVAVPILELLVRLDQ